MTSALSLKTRIPSDAKSGGRSTDVIWPVILLAPFTLLFGLMAVYLPWFVLIPLFILPLFVVAAWWRLEYAIAFLLLIVGGFLPDSLLPSISVLGGTLRAQDLFLGFIAIASLMKHGGNTRKWSPGLAKIIPPIVLLMVYALGSAVFARIGGGVPVAGVIEEFRPYAFWTLPIWVAMAIDCRATLDRFAKALLVAAVILAAAQVIQATTGLPIIHGGRLETATVGAEEYSDVLRSTVPGIYLIIAALLFSISRNLLHQQGILLTISVALLLLTSLLFTFGRTLWFATLLGMILVGAGLGFRKIVRIGLVLALTAAIALVVIALIKPQTAEVMVERALSTSKEGAGNTSLGWRFEENRYAWAKIKQSPLTGIGLGASYKPMGYQRGWEGEQRITHNSHVYVILKLGILGYGVFLWVWAVYWRLSTSLLRDATVPSSDRALLIALRTLLPLVLITSMTRPEWMEAATVCMFSIGLGVMAAIKNIRRTAPAI